MIGMQYNSNNLQGKSVLEVAGFGSSTISQSLLHKNGVFEPVSVLDTRSPSPSTSRSASSSSHGGALMAPATEEQIPAAGKEECVEELHNAPLPFVSDWSEKLDLGLEDWECLLSESAAGGGGGGGGGVSPDQYLLRWISGDVEDPSLRLKQLLQHGGENSEIQSFGFEHLINSSDNTNNVNFPTTLTSAMNFQEQQIAAPNPFASALYCIQQEQPPMKRQNLGSYVNPSSALLVRKQLELSQTQQGQIGPKPFLVPKQEAVCGYEHVVYDDVCKAAELILSGQFSDAQMILARLNHQLSPKGTPLQRAAFYFKEAMHSISAPPRISAPIDGLCKIGAYKVFSEVSPLIQFMNFTSNQAILEAVGDAECIHVFDFDIMCGAQWSSFMLELKRTRNRRVKITAFASPLTHNTIEINLMHENLTQFANELGIGFELEMVNLDSFDPSSYPISSFRSSEAEAIAVNFPLWSVSSHRGTLPLLLHYIKQLSPEIVVSMERGYEKTEVPFPRHVLGCLEYFKVLFESIDAAGVPWDTSNKIERFLFQPSIESVVFGHLRFSDPIPPWRNLFTSAGFKPYSFSNFAETQAECVAKRAPIRGCHVEKRQGSLSLCWQNTELLSAMVWK